MATENKRYRDIQVSETEWEATTPDERVCYIIDLTDGFDVGFKSTSGTKKRLLGGASFSQSGDLVCSDFESTSILDDGTDVTIDSDVSMNGDQSVFSGVIRIYHTGLTNQAIAIGSSSSGGFYEAKDSLGVTQGRIRGYPVDGVQAHLNAGALVVGGATVDGNEMLRVVGDGVLDNVTLKDLAGTGIRAIAVDANGKIVIL